MSSNLLNSFVARVCDDSVRVDITEDKFDQQRSLCGELSFSGLDGELRAFRNENGANHIHEPWGSIPTSPAPGGSRQAGFAAMIADLPKPLRKALVVPISTLLAANLACLDLILRCHFSRRTFFPAKGLKSTDKIKPNTHQTFLKHDHVRP